MKMCKVLFKLFLILLSLGKVQSNNEGYYNANCRSGRIKLFQQCIEQMRTNAGQCVNRFTTQDHFRVACNLNWQVPSDAEFNAQYNHFTYVPYAIWHITNQVQDKYYFINWSNIFDNFRPHSQQIHYLIKKALDRWGQILNLRFHETSNTQQASVNFVFETQRSAEGAIASTINYPQYNIDPNTCTPYPYNQLSYVKIYPSDHLEFDEEVSRRQSELFLRVFKAVIKPENHFAFNLIFDANKFKASFYTVILHELGHTFGILHNNQDIYSLMNPRASREYIDLTEFDIAEMKCLYNLQ